MISSWLCLTVVALGIAAVSACDDPHGIHCLPGVGPKSWECPGRLFDKERRGISETFCSGRCCLCIRETGGKRCTPDDLVDNAEIFINPEFPNYPVNGTCGWCPKGTEKGYYSHKCYDQRTVGFDAPDTDCKGMRPLRTGVLPNGPGNEAPPPINLKAALERFPGLPPRGEDGNVALERAPVQIVTRPLAFGQISPVARKFRGIQK